MRVAGYSAVRCFRRWLAAPAVLGFFMAAHLSCAPPAGKPASLAGLWHATVKNNSGEFVAFQLQVMQAAGRTDLAKVTGVIINGEDRLVSTDGAFDGDTLTLRYAMYDAVLTAKLEGDQLRGEFTRQWEKRKLTRELAASRAAPPQTAPAGSVDLTGDWILKVGEAPQQRLWRAAFRTSNGAAAGTIIPVSGDWGSMTGTLAGDGTLTLNRFDGINSRYLRVKLQADGTLSGFVDLGLLDPVRKVLGERLTKEDQALAAGLPDPNTHTRMSNASEPFRFSFPDVNGKVLGWNDRRLAGKVVVIAIGGTWCPACHEEAAFLQDLYSRYSPRGLEIIALMFEYTGDTERDARQVRLFAEQHGVQYPILLGGSTDEAAQRMPQLVNFNAYPTAIFIGRDGLVKKIHAGFEGKAAGERSAVFKAEMEALVKELLAEARE